MAQNVYVGLAVSSDYNSALTTATIDNLSFTSGLMPLVTSISPTAGPVGTVVTANGTSFGTTQGTSAVTFNGALPLSVTSWSNAQIVATVPSNIMTGPVVVTVNSVPSNSDIIFSAYNPVLNSLMPSAAPIAGEVILTGYGFGASQGSSYVKFNGVTASVVSWSDTSVSVYVTVGTTSGPVSLTMNGVTSNAVQFTVIENLAITSISPNSGAVGTSVMIMISLL
ncbi:MAG: IPT/TIG domain-containing protein [Candidatus Acidiferrales bacterium]